ADRQGARRVGRLHELDQLRQQRHGDVVDAVGAQVLERMESGGFAATAQPRHHQNLHHSTSVVGSPGATVAGLSATPVCASMLARMRALTFSWNSRAES